MPTSKMSEAIRHVRRTMLRNEAMTDGELLESFVRQHDDAALTALVRRHGSMVWGVCRRLLHSHHDAEDAFQATFFVLVRKAATIRDKKLVANWLYGVAHQTAVRARAAAAKRGVRERQVAEMPEPTVPVEDCWSDLQPLLDQELSRLPANFRVPIVLCDLEGKTRQEAARQLGWPEGTVAGRLARARMLLAKRLTRRGPVMSGIALAEVLSHQAASACVPTSLASSAIQGATLSAAGTTAGGVISPQVVVLTEGVLKAMSLGKFKIGMSLLIALAVLGIGVGLMAHSALPQRQADGEDRKPEQPKVDRDGSREPKLRATLQGHTGDVFSVAFSPNSKTLVTGAEDKTIKFWDTATGENIRTCRGHTETVVAVAFSPDGKTLATGSDDKTIKLWNVAGGQNVATLEGHTEGVESVAFSPDGKLLASGSLDETVKLWDVATRKNTATLRGQNHLQGRTNVVRSVAFSPDSKLLATGSDDQTIKLWDVASGKNTAVLKGRTGTVWSVAFSPDGKTLSSGSQEDQTVKLWEVATGKELATLWTDNTVYSVAFSPDGKTLVAGTLVAGSFRNAVQLWDVTTGKNTATLQGHAKAVRSVVFSPDGRLLATGSYDSSVKLWDMPANK